MTTMIEAHHLVKIYGDDKKRDPDAKRAVDDVSFTIEKGEFFVIMGLSGSGKSTVLRMLNGLVPITDGELRINDESLSEMTPKRLREVRNGTVNMVFQHFAIFPHRTVLDNAAYGLQVRGVSKRERVARATEALHTVGLGDWIHHYPSDLSGGMRQRVGLARAVATDAEIVLMDEPFSALDPLIRRSMQDLLIHLHNEMKKTVVFVTHDLNEAMRLGDRIMVMRDGRTVQLGTAQEILSAPADDYVAEFIGDVDRSRVITAGTALITPHLLVGADENPRDVLAQLEQRGLEAAYVLDSQGRVLGVVEAASLHRAAPSATVLQVSDDYRTVPAHTPLNECFELVGGHPVPLGVVGDDGALLGVLPRAALLSTLSNRKVAAHAGA